MFKPLADSIVSFGYLLGLEFLYGTLPLLCLTILLEALILYWLVYRKWRSVFNLSLAMNLLSGLFYTFVWLFEQMIGIVNQYAQLGYMNRLPIEFLVHVFISSFTASLLIEGVVMLVWWVTEKSPEGIRVTSLAKTALGLLLSNLASYVFVWAIPVMIVQFSRLQPS